MSKKGNFTILDNRVIRTPILDSSAFRVQVLFLSLPPNFFISERRASNLIGMSRSTFRLAVKRLERIGAVTIKSRGSTGRCNHYRTNEFENWKITKEDRNTIKRALNPFSMVETTTTGGEYSTNLGIEIEPSRVRKSITTNTDSNTESNKKLNETTTDNFFLKVKKVFKEDSSLKGVNLKQQLVALDFASKVYNILYGNQYFQELPIATENFISSETGRTLTLEMANAVMSARFDGEKGKRIQSQLSKLLLPIFTKQSEPSKTRNIKKHRFLK